MCLEHKYIKDIREGLPEKFKYFDTRETDYYLNENSFTNLKVLVLRDSSIELHKICFTNLFQGSIVILGSLDF